MPISCEVDDLQDAVKCWCLSEAQLDRVAIYSLIAWANSGEEPTGPFMFGDPDAPWVFGDPGTSEVFGGS